MLGSADRKPPAGREVRGVPETPIILSIVGVKTYSELYRMPTAEVLRRIDEKGAPINPGDAFIAVLVLRSVRELGDVTERLDRASKLFQVAGIILAVVAVGVAIAQLVASL